MKKSQRCSLFPPLLMRKPNTRSSPSIWQRSAHRNILLIQPPSCRTSQPPPSLSLCWMMLGTHQWPRQTPSLPSGNPQSRGEGRLTTRQGCELFFRLANFYCASVVVPGTGDILLNKTISPTSPLLCFSPVIICPGPCPGLSLLLWPNLHRTTRMFFFTF